MKPVAEAFAERFFTWRNGESSSVKEWMIKRVGMELVGLPFLITASAVEAVARTALWLLSPVLSLFSEDFAGEWGSVETLKETFRLIPFFALAMVDNIFTSSLDKDNGPLLRIYARICFAED